MINRVGNLHWGNIYNTISDSSSNLTRTILATGATTGFNCSLCEAGTYQTGSGHDKLLRVFFMEHAYFPITEMLFPIQIPSTLESVLWWFVLQAQLQVGTAACARPGPIRQDQVRAHVLGLFRLLFLESILRGHTRCIQHKGHNLELMIWVSGATTSLSCRMC
jgi:hypothetical protein